MRRILLAAALLAGCSAGPGPEPARTAGCACERAVCICPHCKPAVEPAPRCPCKETERPR